MTSLSIKIVLMKMQQIKTLELLLVEALQERPVNGELLSAFHKVIHHYEDEDYLHDFHHVEILSKIYLENFYAHKSVCALTQELHLDYKTLLGCRKDYLRLFAKYYLNISVRTKTVLPMLYTALLRARDHRFEVQPALCNARY